MCTIYSYGLALTKSLDDVVTNSTDRILRQTSKSLRRRAVG